MFRDLNSLSGKVIRTKRAASCTSDNLKAVTSLGPPCFSKPIKIQGESSSMVKSTSWLWEERHVYINRWRATRRRSIHLSGKVANLSEMSIALILQFGSGSMLSTEEEEKKSWTPCLFNTLNQLPIFRPDWIHFFFPPVLQFNQIMGPGQVLQPFCFFKRIEQLIFSFLITRSKCNGRCFSWMSSVLALDRRVQSGHDSLSFAPPSSIKWTLKNEFPLGVVVRGGGGGGVAYRLNTATFYPEKHHRKLKRSHRHSATHAANAHNPLLHHKSLFFFFFFQILRPFIYMAVYIWLAVFLLVWHTFSKRRLFRFSRIRIFRISETKARFPKDFER